MGAAFPGRPDGSNPLSRNPLTESFGFIPEEIVTPTEGMYSSRRDFNTRARKTITVTFDKLPSADITLLLAHFKAVGLGDSFVYIDRASVSYTVYYTSAPKWAFFVTGYYILEPLEFVEV